MAAALFTATVSNTQRSLRISASTSFH
jgi:hypothetical protein